MTTYLLTWNPEKGGWENLRRSIENIKSSGHHYETWSCGVTKQLTNGDRVFLVRLGRKLPRGIVASGWVTSDKVYKRKHYIREKANSGQKALYVDVDFDTILNPEDRILDIKRLSSGLLKHFNWTPQASGIRIPDQVAGQLEREWSRFLGQPAPQRIEALDDLEEKKIKNQKLPKTEREQLIKARYGQGYYRQRLEEVEHRCRLTGISKKQLLVAGHIKPWRESNNREKLDGNNGLLLSPHVDKLFDGGWISFSDAGRVLCKNAETKQIMKIWGLDPNKSVGTFNKKQKLYLKHHRDKCFGRRWGLIKAPRE